MRTTLVIEDDLYREAKAIAARQGRTVTSFIEESLRLAIARWQRRGDSPLPVLHVEGGLRPGIDLNDNIAIRELLEADE